MSYDDDIKLTSKLLQNLLRNSSNYEQFLSKLYDNEIDITYENNHFIFYDTNLSRTYTLESLNISNDFYTFIKRAERIKKLIEFKRIFKSILLMNGKDFVCNTRKFFNKKAYGINDSFLKVINETKNEMQNSLSKIDYIKSLQSKTKFKAKLNLIRDKKKEMLNEKSKYKDFDIER